MAQSSSYKTYGRSTRVLTEESGFAGGMLWTGNNIDETHLKAIVNCDYDDTTGYLKARDPFVLTQDTPFEQNFIDADIDISDYKLLRTFNICAFDKEDTQQDAGWLYIFAHPQDLGDGITRCNMDDILCIYNPGDKLHKCTLDITAGITLKNIIPANILLNYDNQLYGLGSSTAYEEAWLHVYRIVYNEAGYIFKQLDYEKEIKPRINGVSLLEAVTTGWNAARGKDIYTYASVQVQEKDEQYILGAYFEDEFGNSISSPKLGQDVTMYVPVAYVPPKSGDSDVYHLALFQTKGVEDSTDLVEPWSLKEVCTRTYDELSNAHDPHITAFSFKIKFSKKTTQLYFTFYGNDPNHVENYKYSLVTQTQEPAEWVSRRDLFYSIRFESVGDYNRPQYFSAGMKDPWLANTYYTREVITAYSDDAQAYQMVTINAGASLDNLKARPYDLASAEGSCTWSNRMCVWGVRNSSNLLFLSEIDNFYYYPVPHNVALFDTNVISCIPYKDSLLVFTANKVYSISESNDGSFVQTVVQNDMPLTKSDAAHLAAIKNMVLFKSGNYFYMIVPKSQSLTGELSIAPIYKNIAGFLNTLDKSVQEVLQLMYPEYLFQSCITNPTPAAVYAEQDTIHILYDIAASVSIKNDDLLQMGMPCTFKLFLNYNTNLRAWTMYIEDTSYASLEVSNLTKERAMSFIRTKRIDSGRRIFETVTRHPAPKEQPGWASPFRLLLDTGYRTLSSAMQKRFREIQLKVHNEEESITAFGTSFLVDGVWRRNYSKFEETILDSNVVSLMPVLDLNTFITEPSMPVTESGQIEKDPGSDAIELNSWTLDFSHFKREAPTTIRIPVSGKGYSPRFIMIAPNAVGLTINEINWVYRLMNGR